MGVNKFNCEGYYDPTAYEALTKIEQEAKAFRAFRPVVYICSPLAGDMVKNQENARTYCRFAVDAGYIPIAPYQMAMALARSMRSKGLISAKEYAKIDTIIANKYGISSCSIFR